MGTRSLQAGSLLYQQDFWAESVFQSYTAIYRMLPVFLTLNRRVLIEEADIERPSADNATRQQEAKSVVAKLTRQNKWCFEQRRRTHRDRWHEVRRLFNEQPELIPEGFKGLFRDLTSHGPDHLWNEQEIVTKGIEQLTDSRDRAVYHGFGLDDWAFDAVANGESLGAGLDARAHAFRHSTEQLLAELLPQITFLLEAIESSSWKAVRPLLSLSVFTPAFEIPRGVEEGADPLVEQVMNLFVRLLLSEN